MPDSVIDIRPLTSTEPAQAAVRRLFEIVFGQTVSAAHWAWKYEQVADAQALQWVAYEDSRPGEPLGHVGARLMPGVWQQQPCWMAHLTDVMVHPRARQGMQSTSTYARLMRVMAQALLQLVRAQGAVRGNRHLPLLAYGFPGSTPASLGQRMGLYRPLGRVQVHEAVFPEVLRQHWWSWQVRPLHWSEDQLNQQWAQLAADQPQPSVSKTAAYLAWRYRDHPAQPYRCWQVLSPFGRSSGWLVTREEPRALVVDALVPRQLQAPSGWADVMAALVRASGRTEWATWRTLQSAQATVRTETSLIVPVEFRASEIHGDAPSQWTALGHRACDAHLFQPGDTDVF